MVFEDLITRINMLFVEMENQPGGCDGTASTDPP